MITALLTISLWAIAQVTELSMSGVNTYLGGRFTAPHVEASPLFALRTNPLAGASTKLAITQISPTAPAIAPSAFSVTIQAQDSAGVPAPVTQATGLSLSVKTGTGMLGDATTGDIATGSASATISGVTYSKAEAGRRSR